MPPTEPGGEPFSAYLSEIGRHDLLSREDEERLGRSIESGRRASQELEADGSLPPERRRLLQRLIAECERSTRQFIVANLRLVVSIAKRFRSSGMPLADLVQEGNIGLIQAVRKFDYRRGLRFSTYATYWIRQAISRAIANTGRAIRLPVNTGARLSALRKTHDALAVELGRPPTVEELADRAGLPPARAAELLRHDSDVISLDRPLGDDDGELGDLVADERAVRAFEDVVAGLSPPGVDRLLAQLGERDRDVLIQRYGLAGQPPVPAGEVGRRLGVTGERVRQLERRALARLRPELARLAEQGAIGP